MSRAGLVVLFLWVASYICVSLAAPIPELLSSLVQRCDDYEQEYLARSLAILIDRDFDVEDPDVFAKRDYISILDDREFDDVYNEYATRGYDISIYDERDLGLDDYDYSKRDLVVLQRRSIWTKIKDAFSHAFNKVKQGFQKVGNAIKSGFQKAGRAIKSGFQKFGGAVKSGFQKAGSAIKKGFQKAGRAIKHGFEKVKQGFQIAGKAMKKGFQKVGHFIKTTGAKIAKFGLKLYSAVATVASKVVKFIPVIGQPLSMAMKGAAMGANIASNKIHANLGKLDKVSKGLDYVISPMGTAAKKLGGASIAADILTRELYFN